MRVVKVYQGVKEFIIKVKKILKNFYDKKEHKIIIYENIIKNFILTILFLVIYGMLLYKSGIIEFDVKSSYFIKFFQLDYNEIYKDFVIAQIGSTFLTTAFLSLVSSIEDKYILGEKATDLLFGKGLFKFYVPMLILYILMLINIVLLVNKSHLNILVSSFYMSLIILIYLITKISYIFVSNKKYIKLLYAKYYSEYEQNIINNISKGDYNSGLLINLENQTINHIANNNLEYNKNIEMYKKLIGNLFKNMSKKIQEYHLNKTYPKSIVVDFVDIIDCFILKENLDRAIECYNWLLSVFNYFGVYIVYDEMENIFKSISNKILDFNNEYEEKLYLNKISHIITNIEIQQYYAINNDYSYTKLHIDRINGMYQYRSNYFGMIYEKIKTNKYLNNREKLNCYNEIFDSFKDSSLISELKIKRKANDSEERNRIKMPSVIIGQATAFLLLKTLLYKDDENFVGFLEMNIKPEEMRLAIHLVVLSLIKIEKTFEFKNLYSEFYDMDLKYCKKEIKKHSGRLYNANFSFSYKEDNIVYHLQEDYDYICKVFNEKNRKYSLLIDYIFKYDDKLIKQYFDYINKKYNIRTKDNKEEYKNYNLLIKSYFPDSTK